MRHIHLGRPVPISSALLLLVLIAGLSACGGSSGSSKTQKANSGARLSSGSSATAKAGEDKVRALSACLSRKGVTLTSRAEAGLGAARQGDPFPRQAGAHPTHRAVA